MSEDKKRDLAFRVIEAEWEMFTNVPNIGGKAPCQENRQTFEYNRMSQALAWSEETLESYLKDLQEAKKAGRNMLTEKYGHMMKSTSPLEYSRIRDRLPNIEIQTLEVVEEIVRIELQCQEQLQNKYPNLLKRGRRLYSSQDSFAVTSFETYLRGELLTYSQNTLRAYKENLLKQAKQGLNGAEIALEYLVKYHGFQDARQAEERLAGGN